MRFISHSKIFRLQKTRIKTVAKLKREVKQKKETEKLVRLHLLLEFTMPKTVERL